MRRAQSGRSDGQKRLHEFLDGPELLPNDIALLVLDLPLLVNSAKLSDLCQLALINLFFILVAGCVVKLLRFERGEQGEE